LFSFTFNQLFAVSQKSNLCDSWLTINSNDLRSLFAYKIFVSSVKLQKLNFSETSLTHKGNSKGPRTEP